MRHTAPMTAPAPLAQGAARRVEDAFAALHGADSALLLPGLVAATTGTLLALTNPGGHVIASDQTSDPLRGVLTRELAGLGRTVTFVDCTDADAVAAAVRPETQVVYAQSLSDPLMRPAPLASLAFLLLVLVYDTIDGGPKQRPTWLTKSRTYPLLNATSAFVADFVAKRRKGQAMFGSDNASDAATNANDAADAGNASDAPAPKKASRTGSHSSRPAH